MRNPVNFLYRDKVYSQLSTLLSRLYPGLCTLCDAPGLSGRDICAGCQQDLPWNQHACQQCALPLATRSLSSSLCGACLNPAHKPAYDTVRAAFIYKNALPWLITRLKFHSQLNHARLLAELMWLPLEDLLQRDANARPDLMIPVPLHRQRLRERGFNQALELARPLARKSGIHLDCKSLIRVRDTRRQSDLTKSERRKNLLNAFACSEAVADQHVVLIDDVMTSGNTLNAAALSLKQAGASHVSVWVAARATLHAT